MGDRCPRINVSIPSESNSFKRSFDELGLDLNNPAGGRSNGAEGSHSSSGERAKRPRSDNNASSSSNNGGPSSSAAIAIRRTSEADEDGPLSTVHTSAEADNVYTPMEGVEPLPSIGDSSPRVSSPLERMDHFRLSMERFNAFDSNIAVLRHSDSPIPGPSLPRAARSPLAPSIDSQSPTLETSPTPSLNVVERSRPSSPTSTSTLTPRPSALPVAPPASASEASSSDWFIDSLTFNERLLRDIMDTQSPARVRNVPAPRERATYGDRAHGPREQSHAPPLASERRRAHPISPEEALRRLRDIQQSLEEYLQGTSTSLELPSSASPFSPGLVDLPSPHSRNPDHDNVEVDSLAAELSLIHEVFRRLQARARQIEAIQRERREAGTGAAPAVRSAWVTLTRGPESRSQTASEAGEPSSSRPVAVESRPDPDRLFDRDDDLYPTSLAASNRRRRSLYNARPGASNSLVAENASEVRARLARERVDSLAVNSRRSSDDLSDWFSFGLMRRLEEGNRGRRSPVGEPLFTPADWSLPSFRGSTATNESGSTATVRLQPERSRPAPLEPQVHDPFDSWSSDLWLSADDAPRRSATRRPFNTSSHRALSDMFGSPEESFRMDVAPLLDRSSPQDFRQARERDLLGSRTSDPYHEASHTRPPRSGEARRHHGALYADPSDDPFSWRRYHPHESPVGAARRANPDRDANRPNADGLQANSRRRMSRLLALRSMRSLGGEIDAPLPVSHSPTRRPPPPARALDRNPVTDSNNLRYEPRELPPTIRMPRIFDTPDSPPRPASRAAASAAADVRRPAPAARPAATGDAAARANPTSRFNIDSFVHGPFRATIQRSLELESQQRHEVQSSDRSPGVPSLPPLHFQRNHDERLPSLQSLSRFNEDSDLADDSAADPYPLHPLLDGPSNHDWDYLLQRTMSHGQLSAEGQNRTENSSEHERVCPVHGVVHDAEMISPITPLDQVERPRDDEIPGAPQLPTLRRPISATSSAWQELPTSVGLSNPRRPMASLWDSMRAYRPDRPERTSTQSHAGGNGSQAPGSNDASAREASRRAYPRSRLRREPEVFELNAPFELSRRFTLFRSGSRARPAGDYMRDEDLDTSYEALIELTGLLGDVRPRGLSEQAVAALPSGTYGEWATPGETEERCPICLDDYTPEDPVLKVPACSHWFHRGCLEQWLKGARTCPVCRGRVGNSDARNAMRQPGSSNAAGPSAGPSANPFFNRRRRGGYPHRRPPRPEDAREGDNDSDDDIPPFPLPPWRHG